MGVSERERAGRLIAEALERLSGARHAEGDFVRGPGTVGVRVAELHSASPAHLDFGFVLNRDRPDAPVIWDCAAGIGHSYDEKLQRAVETWTARTAAVVLELLIQKRRFADHYRGDDPDGFAGWHVIHGPWLGWGTDDGPQRLQRWAVDHPLLPPLRESILPELDRRELNGAKLFFGSSPEGDSAEVRINGSAREGPSEALRSLQWPRLPGYAYVRAFALLVHEDTGTP